MKEDVKSPREGPLKWDADTRKWCQNPTSSKTTDLAINTLMPSTITTSQNQLKDNFMKKSDEAKQALQNLQKRTNRTKAGLTRQDEDILFIQAKSVK